MINNEMFHGIDDRIFAIPIYGIEKDVDHEHDHPKVKDE